MYIYIYKTYTNIYDVTLHVYIFNLHIYTHKYITFLFYPYITLTSLIYL